jgi:hypothetical protein
MGLGIVFTLLYIFSAYVSNSDMDENLKVGTNVVIAVIIVASLLLSILF